MQKQEVIDTLKNLASKNKEKEYLTLKEIRAIPKLDYYIQFYFKGLANALLAAELPSSKLAAAMKITNEDLLSYLKELRGKLGRDPKIWDLTNDNDVYKRYSKYKISWVIYRKRFGGFKKAIELAGSSSIKKDDSKDLKFPKPKKIFLEQAAKINVIAELLYREFQIEDILIDAESDILAIKNSKFFWFRVKYKDFSDYQKIKIAKSSFEKSVIEEVRYIFVLLSDAKRDFLIVPYNIIGNWIAKKIIDDAGDSYIMDIKIKGKKYALKGKLLNTYLNNWDNIK
jgi:hypothetical protein